MPQIRPLNRRRAEAVAQYLRALPDEHEILAVPFRGEKRKLPVVRIPVSELQFNVELGRLILDRLTVVHTDERGGPEDPAVQGSIEQKVLDLPESAELRRLIARDGQLQPGVITADGYVINGNRRLAVLRQLYRETGDERFGYMDVAVLPTDADRRELFLLEAGLQMTPESRVRYGPVTTALQIERGLTELKLDKSEVAHAMNMEDSEVNDYLERLALMTEYLEFVGHPGDYGSLEGRVEGEGQGKNQHFIEIQKLKDQHSGKSYWEPMLRQLFLLVRANTSFHEIRKIKNWKRPDIECFADTLAEYAPAIQDTPNPAPKGDPRLAQIAADIVAIDEASGLPPIEIPRPAAATKDASDLTSLAFARTEEMRANLLQAESPQVLLEQAARKLEAIDLKSAIFHGAREVRPIPVKQLRALLDRLDARIRDIRGELDRLGRSE
jgi:hypothetical protein